MFNVSGVFTVIFTVSSPPSFSHFSLILNQTNQSGNEISIFHLPLLDEALFLLSVHSLPPLFWLGLGCAKQPRHPSFLTCPHASWYSFERAIEFIWALLSHSSAGNSVNRRGHVSPADLNEVLALLQILLVTLISKCLWASASLYEMWVVNIDSNAADLWESAWHREGLLWYYPEVVNQSD